MPIVSLLLLTSSMALNAVAGPNWAAIEDARAAKLDEKKVIEQKVTAHESALQKLKAACEKVKGNVELTKACGEIIAADAEINTNK